MKELDKTDESQKATRKMGAAQQRLRYKEISLIHPCTLIAVWSLVSSTLADASPVFVCVCVRERERERERE